MLSVGGLSDLVGALLGETHAEQAEKIAISGFHINVGLNHSLMGKNRVHQHIRTQTAPKKLLHYVYFFN